ncbi:hypothetical protein Q6344_09055 [Psychrobacter cibarius]|nr:hypothetical protein Q6344_09055 [Psychrobacter cibarius]
MIDTNYVTLEQFPKAHKEWGDKGFERINKLLDDAVHLISVLSKRDDLDYAGLSEVKSQDNKPVVFINFDNLDRYYVDEKDVKDFKLPKLIKSGL